MLNLSNCSVVTSPTSKHLYMHAIGKSCCGSANVPLQSWLGAHRDTISFDVEGEKQAILHTFNYNLGIMPMCVCIHLCTSSNIQAECTQSGMANNQNL